MRNVVQHHGEGVSLRYYLVGCSFTCSDHRGVGSAGRDPSLSRAVGMCGRGVALGSRGCARKANGDDCVNEVSVNHSNIKTAPNTRDEQLFSTHNRKLYWELVTKQSFLFLNL